MRKDPLLRHNFVCFSLDGGFYGGGMAFVSFQAVLPRMVQSLGGSDALVAMVPFFVLSGFYIPQMVLAGIVERQKDMKPHAIYWGTWQRLPFLVAGVMLLLLPGHWQVAALAFVLAAPFLTSFIGGIGLPAWQEMLAKCIPGCRLSSLWAVRSTISAVFGLLAGAAVTVILARWPGQRGYGVLFLCGGFLYMASLLALTRVREPDLPPKRPAGGARWNELLSEVPARLHRDRRLRWFLLVRVTLCGVYLILPFLSLRALDQLGRPESFLGTLLAAQMAGLLTGNLLGGWLGDRFGGRVVIVLETAGFMAVTLGSLYVASTSGWMLLFFMAGFFFSFEVVGPMTLAVEISPVQERVSYLAIIGMAQFAGLLGMTALNIVLQAGGATFAVVAAFTVLVLGTALYGILHVQEPRSQPSAES